MERRRGPVERRRKKMAEDKMNWKQLRADERRR